MSEDDERDEQFEVEKAQQDYFHYGQCFSTESGEYVLRDLMQLVSLFEPAYGNGETINDLLCMEGRRQVIQHIVEKRKLNPQQVEDMTYG